jgi:hypothetical protein
LTWGKRFRGDSHRAWHYFTSAPTLYRAGLLDPTRPAPDRFAMEMPEEALPSDWCSAAPLDKAGAWELMCLVLADLVRLRHFTFRDLGFRNLHPASVIGLRPKYSMVT